MKNNNTRSEKLFMGLGIITIICGILLALEGNYVAGISGAIVGAWLTFENWNKMKVKQSN